MQLNQQQQLNYNNALNIREAVGADLFQVWRTSSSGVGKVVVIGQVEEIEIFRDI